MKITKILIVLCLACVFSHASAQHITYSPFKHYTERVNAFEKMRAVDSTDIVMLGNSITEFAGDWNKLLKTRHVRNRGVAGDNTIGIIKRLEQILPGKPKAIFLMVGINDLSESRTPSEISKLTDDIIEKILKESPQTKLFVQSVLPINESFGRWKKLDGKTDDVPTINTLVERCCKKRGVSFINVFPKFVRHNTNVMRNELTSDGLHLTAHGYRVWAYELRKYINTL